MSDFLQTKTIMISVISLTWWIYSNDPTVSFYFPETSFQTSLNPIELTESLLSSFSVMCLYVSHYMCVNPMVTRPGMSTFSHDSLHVKFSLTAGSALYCESPKLTWSTYGTSIMSTHYVLFSFQCVSYHKLNYSMRCEFIKNNSDCAIDDGFINYLQFVYCKFPTKLVPLALTFLVSLD